MRRCLWCLFGAGALLALETFAADSPPDEAKTALQALNDFIGDWKGTGAPLFLSHPYHPSCPGKAPRPSGRDIQDLPP